jgi:hypothetical protein
VLASAAARILADLPDDAVVLDVGGWASPFGRADWVLDLLPYETRGLYGYEGDASEERFSASTWVQRDICDHEPWPFADDQFDFVICSHTLEDIRDPVHVCAELQRVARAGYVETPSRLEEQSFGVHGPWVGWSHHRWLVDVVDGGLRFVSKPGVLQAWDHFPDGFSHSLPETDRTVSLWWEGTFSAREEIFIEADDLHAYLREVAGPARPPLVPPPSSPARARRSLPRRAARRLRRAIEPG